MHSVKAPPGSWRASSIPTFAIGDTIIYYRQLQTRDQLVIAQCKTIYSEPYIISNSIINTIYIWKKHYIICIYIYIYIILWYIMIYYVHITIFATCPHNCETSELLTSSSPSKLQSSVFSRPVTRRKNPHGRGVVFLVARSPSPKPGGTTGPIPTWFRGRRNFQWILANLWYLWQLDDKKLTEDDWGVLIILIHTYIILHRNTQIGV